MSSVICNASVLWQNGWSYDHAVSLKCIPVPFTVVCHWTDEAESRHRLRFRSCPRLIVPRTRLNTIGDRSFPVTVAHAWNSLPTNVTASTFLSSFKRQLKTFLFTKSFLLLYIALSNLCTVSYKLLYLAYATLISTVCCCCGCYYYYYYYYYYSLPAKPSLITKFEGGLSIWGSK